jgi:hypothetical protein
MGRYGPVWAGMGRAVPVWAGMGRYGPVWPVWAGMGRYGPVWAGMDRCGRAIPRVRVGPRVDDDVHDLIREMREALRVLRVVQRLAHAVVPKAVRACAAHM